ncbi:MAG: hypothetical protein RMK84_21070, partial [Oscillochloridaceae bacterium]|nr:hypothetical protein [Oscillochloridaceae bacterium]
YALPLLCRQGDFTRVNLYEGDIAALLHTHRPTLEPLFAELAGHLNVTDLQAVREVVADIQRRIERFGNGLPK